ncbi:MAG: hypothetical protein EXS18_04370 [Verrucomicrobiae bacterium]|nr:hypothetical protein [Verrucomicrobiae bacterium]
MASEFRVLFDATSISLIVISIWALLRERWALAAVLLCLGALVRETTVLFAAAVAMAAFFKRDTRRGMLLLLPWAVYAAWVGYVRVRIGSWPFGPGIESNTDWPMIGVVEKFIVYLPKLKELNPNRPWEIPVEILFNLGLLFAVYLAVNRLKQAPHDWTTLGFCAFAALSVVLSAFPWSRYWHTARVLEPLLLFPLLIYLQTREKKYLVPLICAVPVSVLVFLSQR